MVVFALEPGLMVMLNCDDDKVKLGPRTIKVTVVNWVTVPDVPVIVTGYVPCVAVADAVKVRTLEPVVEDGLNEAVTPAGSVDVTARFTLSLKPPA